MAAFSGKKYSAHKTRNLPPENLSDETAESGAMSMGFPQSAGKKYLPVRISTAYFEDRSGSRNLGSHRKTMGLSSRKPIRNIHKLLESPKRTARKRLDNFYDYSKSKENINSTTTKAQALSAKKIAPKVPVPTANSVKKSDKKTGPNQHGQNLRRSRLLPPGTIAGTYVNGRNTSTSKNSISKPFNNRLTLMQKIPQSKRPSDVPEESPQPLESSYEFSDVAGRLPSVTSTAKKLTEVLKGTDSNDSIDIHRESSSSRDQSQKERLVHCCKCSQPINGSNPSENNDTSVVTNPGILMNSKEPCNQGLSSDISNTEVVFERPTVIVMQPEASSQINKHNFDELEKIPVQDGSYSEILRLHSSPNSLGTDESLLFKHTEIACTRLDRNKKLNNGDKTTEFIFELINANKKLLLDQQKYLTDSISQCESNLESMKLMLKNVDVQLDKQKSLESSVKLNGLNNLTSNLSSLLLRENSNSRSEVQAEEINRSNSSRKEDLKIDEETNSAKKTNQRKNRKSLKSESESEIQEKSDLAKNVLDESSLDDNEKIENIENEPPQRRRSSRLALKNRNLSLPIEQSTPVTGKKKSNVTQAKSKPCTPSITTPARNAKWGRRSERPLREYMVLKSAMKFLNTPDSRRYRIGSDEKVQIRDSLDKTDQALLSDKLLKELHDLYQTP